MLAIPTRRAIRQGWLAVSAVVLISCGDETGTNQIRDQLVEVSDSFLVAGVREDRVALARLVLDPTTLPAAGEWPVRDSPIADAAAIGEVCEWGTRDEDGDEGWVNYRIERGSCDPYYQIVLVQQDGQWLVRSSAPSPY